MPSFPSFDTSLNGICFGGMELEQLVDSASTDID
jgi:hypothetical protein